MKSLTRKTNYILILILIIGLGSACTSNNEAAQVDLQLENFEALPNEHSPDRTKSEIYFEAPELFSGQQVVSTDYATVGKTVFTFVSPDCEHSNTDAEFLKEAAFNSPEITFVLVHSGGETLDFQQYVEKHELFEENILHIKDTDGLLWEQFGVENSPAYVTLENDELKSTNGALGEDGFMRLIDLFV